MAKKMYKNKNKNTRDKATQPANATRTVYYEELDELKLESVAAGWWFYIPWGDIRGGSYLDWWMERKDRRR